MKNMFRVTVLSFLLVAAFQAFGAVPAVNVTVSDASGKAAFKGATDAKGTFATANLKPGNYVVQFNSNNAAVKGKLYALVVSAGKKKVTASAVPGEKFMSGGVAMKVDVGTGLNITGQVAAEADGATKNGKKMVWIPPQLGSNMPGHYVEEGSPEAIEAQAAGRVSKQDLQKRMMSGSSPGR